MIEISDRIEFSFFDRCFFELPRKSGRGGRRSSINELVDPRLYCRRIGAAGPPLKCNIHTS